MDPLNIMLGSSMRGQMKILLLSLSWSSMKGRTQDFFAWPPTFNAKSWRPNKKLLAWPLMELPSFVFEGSIKGQTQMFLLNFQLLALKVGSQAKKIASSSPKNKNSQAWSFQRCKIFLKLVSSM
jgi:hypothetical protein